MPTKRFVWSDRYFNDFVETTTINGVFHIFRGRSKIRQILWGLLVIGSFVGCCIVFGYSLKRFTEKPTASTIKVVSSDKGLPFPAVTVCNLNLYQNPHLQSKETYAIMNYLFNSDNFMSEYNATQQCTNESVKQHEREELWNLLLPKESNFIHYCSFSHQADTNPMPCKDYFYPVMTPAGICYTFNGIQSDNPAPNITTTGARYGLKLVLNIEQTTHPTFSGLTGAKVIVHERDDIPRPNLYGVSIPPGYNANIGVERIILVDKTTQVDCRKSNEVDFPFFPNIVYSQYACRENELYEAIASASICGCILTPYRPENGLYAKTPNCTLNNLCCLLHKFTNYDRKSSCQPPCKHSFYEIETSYSSFPNGHVLPKLANMTNMSEEAVKNNFLSIKVFVQDLQTKETITQYTYKEVELLSELGGNMGLFLGISIISIMEVLVLVLDQLKKVICPKKVRQRLDEFDNKLQKYIPDVAMSKDNDDDDDDDDDDADAVSTTNTTQYTKFDK